MVEIFIFHNCYWWHITLSLLWHYCRYFELLILSKIVQLYKCTLVMWVGGAVGCMNMEDNLWIIAVAGLGWAGGVDRQRQRPRVSLATLRAEVVWAQVSGGRGTGDMSTMNDVHQFRSRTPSFLISAEPPTQVHTSKHWHVYSRNIYLGSAFCLHNKSRCMGR